MLTRAQTRAFYDRFGAKQDQQGFYEDVATRALIAHADFESARAVLEFGCGTGRFAAQILEHHVSSAATYTGCDLSPTMCELSRARLARFGDRVSIRLSEGPLPRDIAASSCDRFVANYVLDLLPDEETERVLLDAERVLVPEGRLCLVSLTRGAGGLARAVSTLWTRVHRWSPSLVGGCRPIELRQFVSAPKWEVIYGEKVRAFGITSEVLVARKRRAI